MIGLVNHKKPHYFNKLKYITLSIIHTDEEDTQFKTQHTTTYKQ